MTGKADQLGARITIRRVRLADHARRAGALSVPVLALTGLANRFDLMPFQAVLPTLVFGILLSFGAFVLSIVAMAAIWRDGGLGAGSAVAGTIFAVPGLALAGMAVFAIFAYPRIADVTTDAGNPPQFRVLRSDSPSADGAGQGGSPPVEIAGAAARLYPVTIDDVYGAVTNILADRGWHVAQTLAPAGEDRTARVEAIAKTLLFAFKDDVAIRLIETPDGTRVDMRSASRWGRHDLGQNGRRIRAFLDDLDGALQGLFSGIEEPDEEPAEEETGVPGGGLVVDPVIRNGQ